MEASYSCCSPLAFFTDIDMYFNVFTATQYLTVPYSWIFANTMNILVQKTLCSRISIYLGEIPVCPVVTCLSVFFDHFLLCCLFLIGL